VPNTETVIGFPNLGVTLGGSREVAYGRREDWCGPAQGFWFPPAKPTLVSIPSLFPCAIRARACTLRVDVEQLSAVVSLGAPNVPFSRHLACHPRQCQPAMVATSRSPVRRHGSSWFGVRGENADFDGACHPSAGRTALRIAPPNDTINAALTLRLANKFVTSQVLDAQARALGWCARWPCGRVPTRRTHA